MSAANYPKINTATSESVISHSYIEEVIEKFNEMTQSEYMAEQSARWFVGKRRWVYQTRSIPNARTLTELSDLYWASGWVLFSELEEYKCTLTLIKSDDEPKHQQVSI